MPFERRRWYGLKLSYSVAGAIYAALATESQCCRFSQGYTAWKPETVSVGCQLHRSTSKASGDFQRLVRITSQSCFECQDDCQHCSWMLKAIYLTGALGDNDRFFLYSDNNRVVDAQVQICFYSCLYKRWHILRIQIPQWRYQFHSRFRLREQLTTSVGRVIVHGEQAATNALSNCGQRYWYWKWSAGQQ